MSESNRQTGSAATAVLSEAPSGSRQAVEAFYRSVPVRNANVRVIAGDSGVLVEWAARPAPSPARRFRAGFLPRHDRRRIELDALGREVLEACDGRSTVRAIMERFAARHQLSFLEARLLVSSFLKSLVQRGILGIVTDRTP